MNDINLHQVTNIKISEIKTLEKSNGDTFVVRHFIFESKDRGDFEVTAYGKDSSELHITFE